MHPFISSYSWKYETGTVITFQFIQMVHGMEILWLVLVFPSNSVISIRLPDSASIFTAEIRAIVKAKYIVFRDSLSCLQALQSIKLEHPLIERSEMYLRGKSVRSWCDGSSDRSFMGWTH